MKIQIDTNFLMNYTDQVVALLCDIKGSSCPVQWNAITESELQSFPKAI